MVLALAAPRPSPPKAPASFPLKPSPFLIPVAIPATPPTTVPRPNVAAPFAIPIPGMSPSIFLGFLSPKPMLAAPPPKLGNRSFNSSGTLFPNISKPMIRNRDTHFAVPLPASRPVLS